MNEKILAVIKELREKSKKRKFPQSFDLIINLKEFDVKKPENKITEDIALPHGRGEDASIVVFSDTIKDLDCQVLTSSHVQGLTKDKRAGRKLVNATDFFLSEPKIMPIVGKALGAFLGPRGKMPRLLAGDAKSVIDAYKKSVRAKIKDAAAIQLPVGKESMKDEEVAENAEAVLQHLQKKLPQGKHNIRRVMLKLTMSKPVKIEV
jgi:large subunit ribosomal protein L1